MTETDDAYILDVDLGMAFGLESSLSSDRLDDLDNQSLKIVILINSWNPKHPH